MEFLNRPGYDQFMNIVLDNTVEIVSPTEKNEIGMVVIRGHLDVRSPVVPVDQNIIWNGAVNPINCEKHLFWYCEGCPDFGSKTLVYCWKKCENLGVELGPTKGIAAEVVTYFGFTRGAYGSHVILVGFQAPKWARQSVAKDQF